MDMIFQGMSMSLFQAKQLERVVIATPSNAQVPLG